MPRVQLPHTSEREVTQTVSTVTIPVAAGQILAPNPLRWGIYILPHATRAVTLLPHPSVTLTRGYIVGPGGPPVLFSASSHPGLPQLAWHGVAALATDVGIMEIVRE